MHPALRHFYYSSSRGGYSEEYQAVLDAGIGTAPSTGQQAKQNALVAALKSAGIWDLLDVFYVFATDGDSDFATINWKNPAAFRATLVNSPTFTENQGFNGDGGEVNDQSLNTGWIPATHGVNALQDDVAYLIGINNNVDSGNDVDFGASNASLAERTLLISRSSNLALQAINASTLNNVANATSVGNYISQRRASNDLRLWKNGAQITSAATVSTGRPTFAIYLLAENQAGTRTNHSARQVTHWGVGSALTDLEADFNTAWNNYFTSL